MARNRNVMGPGPGGDSETRREPEPEEPEQEQPQPTRRRPEPEPEPEPAARRKISLGGREYELDPQLAEALDAYRAESEDRNAKQQRAIEELYGRIPRQETPQAAPPNFDTLLFEKPSEALRLYGDQIKKELQEQYNQDQQARLQMQVMEKFWSDFYVAHPDMREDDVLVRSVFGANMNSLIDMTPEKARDALAGIARTELTRIATRHGQQSGEAPARMEESGRTRRGPAVERAQTQVPQGPRTLTEALRRRREEKLRPIRREA